tara:strand:- start:206 stop:550 length:345 start_codon:yes stop_codon:yes gene_type:complete
MKGQIVPRKTIAVITSNVKFCTRIQSSLEAKLSFIRETVLGLFIIYIDKLVVIATKIINNMNNPLEGSFAKAWTDVINPDRTIKVPIIEKENPIIHRRIVQFNKELLLSRIKIL